MDGNNYLDKKMKIVRVGELSPDGLLTVNSEPVVTTKSTEDKIYSTIARWQPIKYSALLRRCCRYATARILIDALQSLENSKMIEERIVGRAREYKVISFSPSSVEKDTPCKHERLSDEEIRCQWEQPFRKGAVWIYRGVAVTEMHDEYMSMDEVMLCIKQYILSLNKYVSELKEEVEALEKVVKFMERGGDKRGTIPKSVRMCVFARDKGRCVACGRNYDLEFDHIIPIAKGGSNTENNIQLLCKKCNQEKGYRIG